MQGPYELVKPKKRMWLFDNDDDDDNGVIPNNCFVDSWLHWRIHTTRQDMQIKNLTYAWDIGTILSIGIT